MHENAVFVMEACAGSCKNTISAFWITTQLSLSVFSCLYKKPTMLHHAKPLCPLVPWKTGSVCVSLTESRRPGSDAGLHSSDRTG